MPEAYLKGWQTAQIVRVLALLHCPYPDTDEARLWWEGYEDGAICVTERLGENDGKD